MSAQCKARLIWRLPDCSYPVEKDGLCIFHLPKATQEEKDKMTSEKLSEVDETEERFRKSFFDLLSKGEADVSIEAHDFTQFNFPALDMSGKKITKTAAFRGAIFNHQPNFQRVIFDGDVDFVSANFKRGAFFHETHFNKAASFMSATFGDENFPRQAWFVETEFKRKANFMQARFYGWANFAQCHCFREVHFIDVFFNDVANFIHSTFEQEAFFSGSTFKQTVSFAAAAFLKSVRFNNVTFERDASFVSRVEPVFEEDELPHARSREVRCLVGDCEFRNLTLKKDAEVLFQRVNLRLASFVDTDLEKIIFRDVEWHRRFKMKTWLGRPEALWDEFRPVMHDKTDEYDLEKIAENYRQLVLNYERKRDYETAESFHIGEMEMRRKKRGAAQKSKLGRKTGEWINSYGLYRISSNYGTSYVQAVGLLFILILLLSAAFLYSGFRPAKSEGAHESPPIEYNLFSDAQHHPTTIRQWVSDYASAISLSFSIITFQKDRFYEPLEGWSRFWLFVAVVVLTAQGALVLLAIRRRFRR